MPEKLEKLTSGEYRRKAMKEVAIDEACKKGRFTAHDLAWVASTSPTQEARELTTRWKTLFAKYANLSKRYWNIQKQMQALRLEPSKVKERYETLDEQFDEVCGEMNALYEDLDKWARSGVE